MSIESTIKNRLKTIANRRIVNRYTINYYDCCFAQPIPPLVTQTYIVITNLNELLNKK